MKPLYRVASFLLLAVLAAAAVLYLPVNSTFILIPFVLVSVFLMLPRDMLKNVKIAIWIFFIVVSLILLAPNLNPTGMSVISVAKNSSITNIAANEIIYEINDMPVTEELLQNDYFGTVKFLTNKGEKFVNANGSLGIEADAVASSNLKFGLDLKGGVHAVIEPNITGNDTETISQIISTLQTRINVYGLRESVFRPIYHEGKGFVEISIAGGSKEELRNLLENQGKFESKIDVILRTVGGSGTLKLDKPYSVMINNGSVVIGNISARPGESFEISGISFLLNSVESGSINLTSTVFNGADIRTVFFDPQRSRIESQNPGYQWSFAIQLSQDGAQRFAWITSNLDIIPGKAQLSSPIVLFLDNNLVDSLSISSQLKGKTETEILITGYANTKDDAIKERARMQSILKSGALPTSVTVVQLESISPTLGIGFLKNAMMAGLAAIVGVICVVSIRYRRPKIVLPMLIISLSEVLIILGVASWINWTIDLPSIAGIIATIGTGVDSQIIIIDQALRGEEKTLTLREKLKRAFFVVFGSGGTVIAAMIPITIILYAFRGFAITTIIGVLIGILIARPAFGAIVQRIVKE
jgi:protein-export membrane protein SecD